MIAHSIDSNLLAVYAQGLPSPAESILSVPVPSGNTSVYMPLQRMSAPALPAVRLMAQGVGLLSIPYALKEGGWASLGVLALLWACTNYTGKVLIKCQEVRCRQASTLEAIKALPASEQKRNRQTAQRNAAAEELNSIRIAGSAPMQQATLELSAEASQLSLRNAEAVKQGLNDDTTISGCLLQSYEDIGQAAFGDAGRRFITVVLWTELIGTCALFFILTGDHLLFLLHELLGKNADLPSQEALMGISAGLFLPTTWLPDLNALSVVGLLGTLSAFGLTGLIVYNFSATGFHFAKTAPLHMHTLPVTFGLSAFVFAGHAVFPSIYRSMKDKREWPRLLDYTYIIVGLTCLAIGVSGYAMYGSRTLEEVTLNLRRGPLQLVATGLILVSPFTKFALTLEPVAQGIDRWLVWDTLAGVLSSGSQRVLSQTRGPCPREARTGRPVRSKSRKLREGRIVRTGLGLFALGLAGLVPYFSYMMGIVGSFLTLTVSVIFPSMCYLRLYRGSISKPEKLLNYGIITLGVVCAVSGTAVSVRDLLKELQ